MRALCPLGLLMASCLPLVTAPPATIDPGTDLDCTDTYWVPAGAAAGSAILVGYTIWLDRGIEEGCRRHDPDICDPQAAIALVPPAVGAVVLAVAAVATGRHIRRCRAARAWQREASLPPMAGQLGAACIPVFDGAGRCTRGTCVQGVCRAPTPQPDAVRRMCAEATGRYRAGLLHELPPACRGLYRPAPHR